MKLRNEISIFPRYTLVLYDPVGSARLRLLTSLIQPEKYDLPLIFLTNEDLTHEIVVELFSNDPILKMQNLTLCHGDRLEVEGSPNMN